MRKSKQELNKTFLAKFFKSPLINACVNKLPFKHEWNKMNFTQRLVYLRNKMVQKNISLTVEN